MIYGLLFALFFTLVFGTIYYEIEQYWILKTAPDPPEDEPTNQEIRQSPEYRAWRNAVLKRDGYMCVWCRSTKNLEVDHVYPFAYFPELRFEITNGRVLCKSCHELTPTYGYKAKTFTQQIINSK